MEALKCPRGVAAAVILGAFFVGVVAVLVVLAPVLQAQVAGFVARVPAYAESLQGFAEPLIAQFKARLTEAGFPVGSIDGVIGPNTLRAVSLAGKKFGVELDAERDLNKTLETLTGVVN